MFENLTSGGSPAFACKEPGQPGVAVIPMISPYVYLGGKLRADSLGELEPDKLTVSISTNNGRTFAPIYSAAPGKRTVEDSRPQRQNLQALCVLAADRAERQGWARNVRSRK